MPSSGSPWLTGWITAACFDIRQTNVLSFDPVTVLATQSGKVRSRGVEVEAEVEAKAPLPHGFDTAPGGRSRPRSALRSSAQRRLQRNSGDKADWMFD
jgi:hypothetical protein